MLISDIDDFTIEKIHETFKNYKNENNKIEYKREIDIIGEKGKKEFYKDIAGFANSNGGYLFIGIDEKDGIIGIHEKNIDQFKNRIECMLNDSIKPRIVFRLKEVHIPNNPDKYVIVIQILKTLYSPHILEYKGQKKFYIRGETGVSEMDINQIKNAFLQSNFEQHRINDFIINRFSEIIINNTPIKLKDKPKVILHLIPLDYFNSSTSIDLESKNTTEEFRKIFYRQSTFDKFFNYHGIVFYQESPYQYREYIHLFRNGCVEIVNSAIIDSANIIDEKKCISSENLLLYIYHAIYHMRDFLYAIKINPPFVLHLNLFGVKDHYLAPENFYSICTNPNFMQKLNHLSFKEMYIEDKDENLAQIFKPWFDHIFQSFGYASCSNYTSDRYLKIGKILYI
mgnify:CR=1 FL=1